VVFVVALGIAFAALFVLAEEDWGVFAGFAVVTFALATLAVLDAVLELDDAVEEGLGAGRATGDVHVDGDDPVDALDDGVVVEDAAAGCAIAHGDDPLGFWHLVVNLAQNRSHLLAYASRDDHQVGLPRRRTEKLGAEAADVELAPARRHHLDGTAGKAKGRRPDGVLTAPIHQAGQQPFGGTGAISRRACANGGKKSTHNLPPLIAANDDSPEGVTTQERPRTDDRG